MGVQAIEKNVPFVVSSVQETAELARTFYEQMVLIRHFENKSAQLYSQGAIGGFCHLYSGQEAIAVGSCAAKMPQDTVITSYRSRGHLLALGASIERVMAELTGRSTGSSGGKGGGMHIFATEHNFYGGHGIVGAQIAMGTGLAFAHRYLEDSGVCLVFLGDGAANQGQFFESMNMAALWDLPVIFVIENNRYAMGTSACSACAGTLYTRGEAFGIPGHSIKGHNVFEVYGVFSGAIAWVRKHSRPLLIEVEAYRFRGHSMSDPGHYRTREELDGAKKTLDPIALLEDKIVGNGWYTREELEALSEKAKASVSAAADFALSSPEPSAEELYTDITLP